MSSIVGERGESESSESPLQIEVRVHKYSAVGSLAHPNHFVLLQGSGNESRSFFIGTNIVCSRKTTNRQPTVGTFNLGFGITFEAKAKEHQKTQKRSRPADPKPKATAGQRKRKQEFISEQTAGGQTAGEQTEPIDIGEPDPTTLSSAAKNEMQIIAKQLSSHKKDIEEPEEEDPKPKKTAEAEAPKRIKMSARLGLTDIAVVKRRGMVCLNCSGKIEVGDHRFEYSFSQQRPPRSIHVDCVGQISRASIGPSLQWLREQLNWRRDVDKLYIEGAIQVLQPLSSVGQAATSSSSRG